MNSIIQWITIFAAGVFLIQVLILTAKNKLTDKHAFVWIVLAIAGVLGAVFLPRLNVVAALLGVSYMPSLVFTIAFLVVLTVLIYQNILLSKHERQINELIQEIGFLENQLIESKKKEL